MDRNQYKILEKDAAGMENALFKIVPMLSSASGYTSILPTTSAFTERRLQRSA